MRLAELQAAGRHPQLPLRVTLADGAGAAELRLDSLLRVLPGQRYVGAGEWRGRKVLAKLLVGGKAARHFQRELEGARLLAAQGLTTDLKREQPLCFTRLNPQRVATQLEAMLLAPETLR